MSNLNNISWIFVANLFVAFTKWLIVVLIANYLTVEEVGIYSLAFAVTAPITLFANMKLRSLFITEERFSFSDYLYTRNFVSSFMLLTIILVSILFYNNYASIIILVGISKLLDLQSDMLYGLPHKNSKMKFISRLMIIKHIITIVGFVIALILTKNLFYSLLIQVLLQVIILYTYEKNSVYQQFPLRKSKYSFNLLKQILKVGLPLGIVQMLVSLNTSFPRYVLESIESAEVLGYFSAIAYITTIGNMMMNSISQNFLPQLSSLIRKREYKDFSSYVFVKLSLFSLLLGMMLIIISVFLGEELLSIVYGNEYANYKKILVLMSISLAINFISWNFDTALLALKYINIQPVISFVILLITVPISILWIKQYGIYGAAYTLILTNCVQLLLRTIFLIRKMKVLKES